MNKNMLAKLVDSLPAVAEEVDSKPNDLKKAKDLLRLINSSTATLKSVHLSVKGQKPFCYLEGDAEKKPVDMKTVAAGTKLISVGPKGQEMHYVAPRQGTNPLETRKAGRKAEPK
jgi:hypothetical protein